MVLLTIGCAPSNPILSDIPTHDELESGWTRIYPAGDTKCAHGDAFSFWVRSGSSNRLLIYLAGGGCWNYETCKEGSTQYTSRVGNQPDWSGILDADHPTNPFADYNMVYIPSCTGDAYKNNEVATYRSSEGEKLTIHHKGFTNVSAVLDWIYLNIPKPEAIFLTGCSAGSFGSAYHAPYFIKKYPQIPLYQLGDSFAMISPENKVVINQANLPGWIPAFNGVSMYDLDGPRFYSIIAQYYPNHRFSQVNYLYDEVQMTYYGLFGGESQNWVDDFETGMRSIHASTENFKSYTIGGSEHCVINREAFYSTVVGGVSLHDWVADYAAGHDIVSVQCHGCSILEPNAP